MNIHKKIYIFLLRCRLCQLDAAVDLRFASFNTSWPSAQVPSLGVVPKISARFSMPSAWKCQIRKFICLPIGEYACHNTMPPRHFSHVPAPHSSTKERQGWRGGGRSESEVREVRKKAKKAKKCCCPMMSKTRPSSRSMGATPGGARGARGAQSAACATWRRATTRGGGEERLGKERRARRRTTIARREEENFFKARKKAKIAKTPVFSTTLPGSLNRIVLYC